MVRVGIVGPRGMGNARAKTIGGREDSTVTYIAGRDEEFLKTKAEQIGCDYTTDWEEVCARDDVDAVIVSTPNSSHHPIAMKALEHGKHVLIEYPMAQSLQEIDDIIEAAKSRGLKLQIGLSDRFEGAHLYIREHLPSLGRPMVIHGLVAFPGIWKWAADDAILGDYFSLANFHHIDQWADLFGPAEWVSATLTQEKDDAALNTLIMGATQIQFKNGVVGWSQFGMGTAGQHGWATYALCTDGSLMHDLRKGEIVRTVHEDERKTASEAVSQDVFDDVPNSKDIDLGGFLDAIVKDQACTCPGEMARHSCEICFASTESAKTGKRVRISEPTGEVQVR